MTYHEIRIPLESEDIANGLVATKMLDWFLRSIPARKQELTTLVRETPKYVSWNADFSDRSLSEVSDWLPSQIKVRQRSDIEAAYFSQQVKLPPGARPSDWILDERTQSICADVGIYVGESMRYKNPNLEWVVKSKKRGLREQHSGFPLLRNGKVTMDCVQVVESTAKLIVANVSNQGLKKYLEIWQKKMS